MPDTPDAAPLAPRRTDLPEFNLLAQAVEGLREGACTPEAALEALAMTHRLLAKMQEAFLDVLWLREHTPLTTEVASSLDDHYTLLGEAVAALAEHLEEGREAEAGLELERMRGAVQGICDGLRRLWEDEQQQERACDIPAADEMVRVGRAYLRGRMPHASLRFATSRFEGYHRGLLGGLELLQPSAREKAELDAVQPRLEAALERQEAALVELQRFLDDDDEARLAAALDEIVEASRDLVKVQRGLKEAHEWEPRIACPRCGAANTAGERVCGACHARLPWVPPSGESQIDLLESGAAANRGVQYEHLVALEEVTRAVQRGDESPEALGALLRAQEARTRDVEARLARMSEPSPNTPPEQREVYESARASLVAGMARMGEGVARMRQALDEGALDALEEGLQTCLRAVDDLSVLQALINEIAAAQAQQG